MKLLDVVNQLRFLLPVYTDRFSDTINVSLINASGGVVTVTTDDPHELETGDDINLAGVTARTHIDSVSKDGLVFTFGTSEDHDLTYEWEEHDEVSLDGFTDGAWNDSFKLLAVPNRRTFKVRSVNSLPTLSGNEVLLENNRVDGVNGSYEITVTSPTAFTVTRSEYPISDGVYTGGKVSKNVRVAKAATLDRARKEYTKKAAGEYWIFVVGHDVETSKQREALSDAVATIGNGQDLRLRLIDGFTCFVFVPTSDEITGEVAIDICRYELVKPIYKCLYGVEFDNNLETGPEFKTIPLGHGLVGYDKAVLLYGYEFQVPMDLTDEDAVDAQNTSAFRDIEYEQRVDPEKEGVYPVENMQVNVDLDEEPIAP